MHLEDKQQTNKQAMTTMPGWHFAFDFIMTVSSSSSSTTTTTIITITLVLIDNNDKIN